MNVNRLIKEYSDKGKVQFIEGVTFKTIIPIVATAIDGATDGAIKGAIEVSDTINDTVNDTVKQRMVLLIKVVLENPGMKSGDLAKIFGLTEVTIRRDLQKITKLVKFAGAPKTGGYQLTDYMVQELEKNSNKGNPEK